MELLHAFTLYRYTDKYKVYITYIIHIHKYICTIMQLCVYELCRFDKMYI